MDVVKIVDIYSGNNVTYDELVQLWFGGFRGIQIKSSMGWGDDVNVQKVFDWAKRIGFLVGIYHWIDGTNGPDAQVVRFSKWIDILHPDWVAGDHEQWWADWDKYFQWALNKISFNEVPWLSAAVIDHVGFSFMKAIKTLYPKLYAQLYTSIWFSSCDPNMKNWISVFSGWYADYTKWSGHKQKFLTWDAFNVSIQTMQSKKIALPDGATTCDVEQIGTAELPGLQGEWDIDIFRGTLDDFKAKLSGTYVPPIVIPPVPVMKYWVTNLMGTFSRTEASWNTGKNVKYYAYHTNLDVLTDDRTWCKLADGTWVARNRVSPKPLML